MYGLPTNHIGYISSGNISRPSHKKQLQKSSALQEKSFSDLLKEKISKGDNTKIEFSKHAQKKIEQRRISFSDYDLNKIKDGVSRLRQKGGKEGLLLYKDLGLVVNVDESKVITCVDRAHLRENVFVNIDSVAIVE